MGPASWPRVWEWTDRTVGSQGADAQKALVSVPEPAEQGLELEKAKGFTTMVDVRRHAPYLWGQNDLKRLAGHR